MGRGRKMDRRVTRRETGRDSQAPGPQTATGGQGCSMDVTAVHQIVGGATPIASAHPQSQQGWAGSGGHAGGRWARLGKRWIGSRYSAGQPPAPRTCGGKNGQARAAGARLRRATMQRAAVYQALGPGAAAAIATRLYSEGARCGQPLRRLAGWPWKSALQAARGVKAGW